MTLPDHRLWSEQGCAVCRRQWVVGDFPPEIAVNIPMHASLHRCEVCGAYWEQTERQAVTIDSNKVEERYPIAAR